MKKFKVKIRGLAPLIQGAAARSKKRKNETMEHYENRVWKERAHVDDDGNCVIPGMAFKNALVCAAKRLAKKRRGRGKYAFVKLFELCCFTLDSPKLGTHIDDVKHKTVFIPCDCRRGLCR